MDTVKTRFPSGTPSSTALKRYLAKMAPAALEPSIQKYDWMIRRSEDKRLYLCLYEANGGLAYAAPIDTEKCYSSNKPRGLSKERPETLNTTRGGGYDWTEVRKNTLGRGNEEKTRKTNPPPKQGGNTPPTSKSDPSGDIAPPRTKPDDGTDNTVTTTEGIIVPYEATKPIAPPARPPKENPPQKEGYTVPPQTNPPDTKAVNPPTEETPAQKERPAGGNEEKTVTPPKKAERPESSSKSQPLAPKEALCEAWKIVMDTGKARFPNGTPNSTALKRYLLNEASENLKPSIDTYVWVIRANEAKTCFLCCYIPSKEDASLVLGCAAPIHREKCIPTRAPRGLLPLCAEDLRKSEPWPGVKASTLGSGK